jgi:hypothetical protein
MDSNYRPQSPDLSSYAPQSPDLSGFQPPDPNPAFPHTSTHYSGFAQNPAFSSNQNPGYGQSASAAGGFQGSAYPGNNANSNHNNGFGSHYSLQAPTSIPQLPEPAYQQQVQQQAYHQPQQQHPQQYIPPGMMAQQQQYQPYPQQQQQQSHYQQPQFLKHEDNDPDYNPHTAPAATPNKRIRRSKQEPSYSMPGNSAFGAQPYAMNRPGMPAMPIKSEPLPDPTLGCQLRTTFPVARIKRLMQADEDIGKVAQVTPTVVSRALELFMIKLISASAMQARGGATAAAAVGGANAGAAGTPAAPPSGSGPKRILVQHLKKAVLADDTFDFLREIVDKVPDAPAKGKREGGGGGGGGGGAGSDSEDGGGATKTKKRGKRRKDSGDDF